MLGFEVEVGDRKREAKDFAYVGETAGVGDVGEVFDVFEVLGGGSGSFSAIKH